MACCDTKAFGKPCEECAFDAPTVSWESAPEVGQAADTPERDFIHELPSSGSRARALEFATATVAAGGFADRFWRTAHAAQMYWQATASEVGHSREDEAVIRAEQEAYQEQGGHLMPPPLLFSPDDGGPAPVPVPAPVPDPASAQSPKALSELTDSERKEWLEVLKKTRTGHPNRGNGGKDTWPVIIRSPPTDPGSSEGPICGIEKFGYPECWAKVKSGAAWTFYFKAHLKYMPKPKPTYACECCVFRQLIHKFHIFDAGGDPIVGYENDKPHRVDWAEPFRKPPFQAGGERPDGSRPGDKNKPEEGIPHGGGWINTACELCFTDKPTIRKVQSGKFNVRIEFVGLVFDRCRNWLLIAAKRFVWSRRGYYKRTANGKPKLVAYKGGSQQLTGELGPGEPGKNLAGTKMSATSKDSCKCG